MAQLLNLKSGNKIDLAAIIKSIQNKIECSPKDIWKTLRLALTGQPHGPSLHDIINIYGLNKTIQLIQCYVPLK